MGCALKKRLLIFLILLGIFFFLSNIALAKFPQVAFPPGQGCLACHSDKNLKKDGRSLFIDPNLFRESVHKKQPCAGCHLGFTVTGSPHEEGTESPLRIARLACKNCHPKQFAIYRNSSHVKAALLKRNSKAPTCFNCHGNHYIKPAKASDSPVSKRRAPKEVCGKCHHEELESYLENYHGKTLVVLGYNRPPSCFTCHGSHNNKSLKEESDVEEACRQCHKTATANLAAAFVIHAHENDFKKFPALFITKWFFTFILVGTLGFFYTHSLLWFIRKLKDKRKGHEHHINLKDIIRR